MSKKKLQEIIKNIFKTKEFRKRSVCAKFAHTTEVRRTYQTNYYNWEMIDDVYA